LTILKRKPLLLWGISLMFSLLTVVTFWLILIPVIYIPVVATLQVGMMSVFLAGYRGMPIESSMLFTGFNDFKRVAGGMLWMLFWLLIWFMIPIVGIVFVIIKSYAYSLVPYILLTKPDVSATEALKLSRDMTRGYKGKMFCTYLLIVVIVVVVFVVLALLGQIPYAGFFFYFLLGVFGLLCGVFLPLFMGLVSATFYDEIERVSGK